MAASADDSLLAALSAITGTGGFHSTGTAPFFFPLLHVADLGELAFPLSAAQAEELIALSEAAPYGLGDKTVRDENVRKCWQLDASRFSIKSPQWKKFLEQTTTRVREDLGIGGKISAHPYKLLLYGKGGHFKAHRDTEKLDAMFGTLIVALPSAHEGGRLFIRHGGQEIEVDFSREEHRHEFQHAAFFADCEHEVEPVRSGYRCCLVYNLRLDEGDPGLLNLPLDTQAKSLVKPLHSLKQERRGELTAILLEHAYTEANFSLRRLKGNDAARAKALFAAAKDAGFTAHLALVTYHQMGELEENHRRRRKQWEDEDDVAQDGTMGEIYDEDRSIDHWRDAGDQKVTLGCYRIEEDVLLTHAPFGEGEPDEKEAEGYTGNAGCTMDYWYRRAAVVLWAEEDHEKILCSQDFGGACMALAGLAGGAKTGLGSPFFRLGKAVVEAFPDKLPPAAHFRYHQRLEGEPFAVALEALAKAGSRELLEMLVPITPDHAWALCSAGLWKKLHRAFGVDAFAALHQRLIKGNPQEWRHILYPLLDALLITKADHESARAIAARLSELSPKPLVSPQWGAAQKPATPGDRAETGILLAASYLLDDAVGRCSALDFLLADRSLDYVREVLGPVLAEKRTLACLTTRNSLAPDTLAFARNLLRDEVARPILPFPDWTRPCPTVEALPQNLYSRHPSTSQRTTLAERELSNFMADPEAKTHEFRYPQEVRSALENFIRDHALDLDHVTLRKGTPHTLACTKNDKSHHRALARRAADEKLLKNLAGL